MCIFLYGFCWNIVCKKVFLSTPTWMGASWISSECILSLLNITCFECCFHFISRILLFSYCYKEHTLGITIHPHWTCIIILMYTINWIKNIPFLHKHFFPSNIKIHLHLQYSCTCSRSCNDTIKQNYIKCFFIIRLTILCQSLCIAIGIQYISVYLFYVI